MRDLVNGGGSKERSSDALLVRLDVADLAAVCALAGSGTGCLGTCRSAGSARDRRLDIVGALGLLAAFTAFDVALETGEFLFEPTKMLVFMVRFDMLINTYLAFC